jgi:recombination endonuclease VII
MKTITCIGYEKYKCGKELLAKSTNHKRCSKCARGARLAISRRYRATTKGKQAVRNYENSPQGSKMNRERGWRNQGIIGVTYKLWKRDSKRGCGFKFLGNCAGMLGADHDHETGKYRGALCVRHNWALGALGDTSEKLARIAKILKSRKSHAARVGLGFVLPKSL